MASVSALPHGLTQQINGQIVDGTPRAETELVQPINSLLGELQLQSMREGDAVQSRP